MDFSAIPQTTVRGRVLRALLGAVPSHWYVPVLQGPGRGLRWRVGAGVHGQWLGSYELSKVAAFARLIAPGMTVLDVGAHAGYYALIAARLVQPNGRVVAFEPSSANASELRRHLAANCLDVCVEQVAVSDQDGQARFDAGPNGFMGRLAPEGSLVRTVTLDSYLAGIRPDVVKIDAEGAEEAVLRGARRMLAQRPVLLLATHGEQQERACLALLREHGFSIERLSPGEYAAR